MADEPRSPLTGFGRKVLIEACAIVLAAAIGGAILYGARRLFKSTDALWFWPLAFVTGSLVLLSPVAFWLFRAIDADYKAEYDERVALHASIETLQSDLGKVREDVDELLKGMPR